MGKCKELEIFFNDFTPEAQKRILEFYEIKDPKEANWPLFPVTSLYYEPEEEGK